MLALLIVLIHETDRHRAVFNTLLHRCRHVVTHVVLIQPNPETKLREHFI